MLVEPVIESSMRNHPSNADVQENGCAAVQNLAVNENNRVKISNAGGTRY